MAFNNIMFKQLKNELSAPAFDRQAKQVFLLYYSKLKDDFLFLLS